MMKAKRRRIVLAALTGGVALVVPLRGGDGSLRAMAPCAPFNVVHLTGTLIEVRQGDAVVPPEQAILDGVPRFACVSPTNTNQQTPWITVVDCDFPTFSVDVMLAP